MKVNNFRYFVSQALRSFVRNGLTSVTSIFTVFCCMLILGLFLVISINLNYISDQVQKQCQLQAFVLDGRSDTELSEIKKEIEAIDNVSDASLVTKEDALVYMKDMFEENADYLSDYEDDNPFPDSYMVTLTDLSLSEQTASLIEKIEGVEKVENDQEVMNNVLSATGAMRTLSFWIMLILGFVSIFIIANTIKLAVYARRKEINVMKFVGATNWFIRWPFIFEGIIIGIIGALISFGLISWGYIMLLNLTKGINLDMFSLKTYSELWWILLSSFVGIGILIGALGSAMSLRKHLDV